MESGDTMSIARIAVACPGQGILPQGCLHGFRQYQPRFQRHLDCIDETLGEKFSRHMVGPPESSTAWSLSTANAQPAILGASYIIADLFKELHGIELGAHPRVHYLLGHSLGEYTAHLLGGAFSLAEAVGLVRKRGRLMETLVGNSAYEMRVLVFRPTLYDVVCETAAQHGVLACANNATQVSVLGPAPALDQLVAALNAERKTVLKQTTLPVQIPFHNKLLRSIEPELAWPAGRTSVPIVSNYSGAAHHDGYGLTVKGTLAPVQWKRSMEFLIADNVTHVINLGPGTAVDAINARFPVTNVPLKSVADMAAAAQVFA